MVLDEPPAELTFFEKRPRNIYIYVLVYGASLSGVRT